MVLEVVIEIVEEAVVVEDGLELVIEKGEEEVLVDVVVEVVVVTQFPL